MSTKYIKKHWDNIFAFVLTQKIQFMQSICFSTRSYFYLILQLGCLLRHKTVTRLTCVSINPDVKYILIVCENTTYMFYAQRAVCYDCVVPKATLSTYTRNFKKVWSTKGMRLVVVKGYPPSAHIRNFPQTVKPYIQKCQYCPKYLLASMS